MAYKRREPEEIVQILKRVVPRSSTVDKFEKVKYKWRMVVGEDIASLTKVISFKYGSLRVGVLSSPLLSELTFMQDELLEKMRVGENSIYIRNIVFKGV